MQEKNIDPVTFSYIPGRI